MAIVEHRHTKDLILYDSVVTDSRTRKPIFDRARTEDKREINTSGTHYKKL